MAAQSWLKHVRHLLMEMKVIDFGYPLGTNTVLSPQPSGKVDETLAIIGLSSAPWREFYSCCDGLCLPDVHVGYFVKPLATLLVSRRDSDPSELAGLVNARVLTFGSTGGGGLFVLRLPGEDVLYLPPGPLHNGVYDSSNGQVSVLAPDFPTFLDVLLKDIEAFVRSKPHHFLV